MKSINHQPRPYWSGMASYLLVTTGAVVGLGNIVRFPFYVYKLGGSFVLLYIVCELLISIPILFAELIIGRRGKQNPVGSFEILSIESDANRAWRWLGWLCFIILFLSLADYTASVSFPVVYFSDIFSALMTKGFNHAFSQTSHIIAENFFLLEICFLAFLFITMLVILRGINRGLETISKITVPLYFIILLGLAIYSCSVGHVREAVHELFSIRPSISFITVLITALTYAFFKLNVGMGSMIVYGSYLPYSVPLGRSTFLIVCFDAIISLLSYFVIYPLFIPSHASEPATYQDTLFFFSNTMNGEIVALLFFFAAIIAAWTPTIAMAESATVILIERFHLSRKTATLFLFAAAGILGTVIVLSHHQWSNLLVFNRWSIATSIDHLTTIILIPLSALLTAIFAGWIVQRNITEDELGFKPTFYVLWRFLIKFIAPICIVITVMMLMG